ncbi:MAG: Ribonuclease P protein component [Bacteroidia bacterium]|nr:Ribonuclease P protein component [Bacteroidia bacterium]
MEKQTFKKEERLSSRKLIEKLAAEGKSFLIHPFKVIALETKLESAYPVQVLMTAPKKKFPRAVDRNRIKRLMREAWRKNKHTLYKTLSVQNKNLAVMLVYVSGTLPEYKLTEDKIILILQRLSKYETPDQ